VTAPDQLSVLGLLEQNKDVGVNVGLARHRRTVLLEVRVHTSCSLPVFACYAPES
jgi:hypothetical protein